MVRWRWNLRGSMVLVALTFKKCHRTSPFGPFIAPTGLENNCHTAENLWKSYEIIIIWMFKAPKECGPCSPCRTRNPHQSGASGGHIFGLPFGADPGGGYQFWGAWSAARGGDVGLGVNDIIRIHIYIYMWWIYSDFIWFYMILYGFVDDFPHLVDFWRDLLDVFSYFLLWRWCLLILGPSWDVTLGRADGVMSFKLSRLHPRMSAMLVASAGANLVVSIIALHCLILTLCFITFP